MKILVINGSPAGENSITLQTMRFIQTYFPKQEVEVLHVGQRIRTYEKDFAPAREAIEGAELLIFCYPVYTFLVPAQLHRFLELLKDEGMDLHEKYATQITTSKHFYDVTAHEFIRENCEDLGLKVLPGLSADMEDLLGKKGRREAVSFFHHLLWTVKQESGAKTKEETSDEGIMRCGDLGSDGQKGAEGNGQPGRIAIVADLAPEDKELSDLIKAFQGASEYDVAVVNIREFPFAGGCLGCFHCASDGKCIYKDQFDEFLREKIQTAQACVYAFRIKDHSMGQRFKLFDDRQFCNGHRTVTMGKPVGYLIAGELSKEPNLRMVMESRAQVGGNYLAGVALCDPCGEEEINGSKKGMTTLVTGDAARLARELSYAIRHKYNQPANFYGVGGMKIFRDLIYQMQGMMREDHRFYKEHDFYDFPQKRMGTILGMYLVGAMINNENIRKKIGGNMTKGMLMPYENVIAKAKKRKGGVCQTDKKHNFKK